MIKRLVSVFLSIILSITTINSAVISANVKEPYHALVSEESAEPVVWTANDLLGVWNGSYTGSNGDSLITRTIKLYIYKAENENFYGYMEIDSNKIGSHFIEGVISNAHVSFKGTEWYENAVGASFCDFSGIISSSNDAFSILGTVNNDSQRSFSIVKEDSQPINPRHLSADTIGLDWTGFYDGHTYNENTRRTLDLHISDISAEGDFAGTVSIDKYTGEEKYVIGTYRITGKYDEDKGMIQFQGTDWINNPIGTKTDEFEFIEFKGFIHPENKTIYGNTENGIWSVTAIDYSHETSQLDNFVLGRDNNSYTNGNSEKTDGFYGLSSFPIDEDALNNVFEKATFGQEASIKSYMMDANSWGGSCYGMASTMALAYNKTLPLSSLGYADTYFTLQKPCDNEKLLNMVDYYHILQYIDNDEISISKTYRSSNLLDKLLNWYAASDSLATFLKKMVDAAKDKKVLVFSFIWEEGGGHAVLLTGYEYDHKQECYRLQIYDENSVHSDNVMGSFSYLSIPKDFSSFTYTDSMGDVIDSDNFSELWLQDISLWNSDILKTKKIQEPVATHTTIMFRKGLPASITNELGEILSYDGRVFSGDMKIYDTKYIFDDNEYLFDVDKSEVYTVGGNGIAVYNDKMYSSIYGIGIEDIKIDDMGNISMNGSNGKFTVYTTNDQANGNLYKIGGNVNGAAYIGLNDAELKVSVETQNTKLSDITGSIIDNLNVAHNFSTDKATELLLTLNENGVVAQNDNNESIPSYMPSESSQPTILPTGITEVPVQPTVTPSNTPEIPKASISPTSVGAKKAERTAIQSIRAYNKQLTVVVKKIKAVSGYHIQYGTDRKFSRNTKNRYSKTTKINLIGLKAKKKYYVRARTYTIIKGKKYFGSWCGVRAKKTK